MKVVSSLIAVSVPLMLLTGCPDPEGQYNDFRARAAKIDSGSTAQCDAPAPCTALPQPGELDGTYFFAFAASLDLTKPMVFEAKITSSAGASGTEMHWVLQALDWSDRKTPVGAPLDLGTIAIDSEGMINADLPPLDVVGEANPFSHSPITADVSTLSGRFCAGETFISGLFDGTVSKPITIPLTGSSWTLTKVSDAPNDYPEPPPIDCNKTPAEAVGTWE